MVVKIDFCEECGEAIVRCGNNLYCPNGCYEDDVRNFFSEDQMEAGNTGGVIFPKDEALESERISKQKYNRCDHCVGEDCACCEVARGW